MEIKIIINNRKTKIVLIEKKAEVDFVWIEDEYSLAEKLLPEIDNLLKKNKLEVGDIEKIEVKSDQTDNFTSTRIAKAVAEMWKIK